MVKKTAIDVRNELKTFWNRIEKLKRDMTIYTKNLKYQKDRDIFWKFFKSLEDAKESLTNFQYRVNDNKHRLDKIFKK